MRFTFLKPSRKTPSFKAKYDSYVLLSLASAQILAIATAILFLWNLLPETEPVYAGLSAVIFISLAFFYAYLSPQNAHSVSIISVLCSQLLILRHLPPLIHVQFFSLSTFFSITDFIALIILFDAALIGFIFYLNARFPAHRPG